MDDSHERGEDEHGDHDKRFMCWLLYTLPSPRA